MNNPIIVKFLSFFVNILTCLVSAIIVVYLQDWFGKGDIYAFIFWTVPFAAGIALSGAAFLSFFRETRLIFKLLFIILMAGLLSLGWAYSVATILGVWIGAFSFPILYLWIGGCAVQLLFLNWRLPLPEERPKLTDTIIGILYLPVSLVTIVLILYYLSRLFQMQ